MWLMAIHAYLLTTENLNVVHQELIRGVCAVTQTYYNLDSMNVNASIGHQRMLVHILQRIVLDIMEEEGWEFTIGLAAITVMTLT